MRILKNLEQFAHRILLVPENLPPTSAVEMVFIHPKRPALVIVPQRSAHVGNGLVQLLFVVGIRRAGAQSNQFSQHIGFAAARPQHRHRERALCGVAASVRCLGRYRRNSNREHASRRRRERNAYIRAGARGRGRVRHHCSRRVLGGCHNRRRTDQSQRLGFERPDIAPGAGWPRIAPLIDQQRRAIRICARAVVDGWTAGQKRVREGRTAIVLQRRQSGVDWIRSGAHDVPVDSIGKTASAVAVEIMAQRLVHRVAIEEKVRSIVAGHQRA